MTTRPETVPGIARISRKNARTGRAPFIVVIIIPRALQPRWGAVSRLCDPGYASALLDHRVTGVDAMSSEVAAVTQGVYSAADRVLLKSEALSIWLIRRPSGV